MALRDGSLLKSAAFFGGVARGVRDGSHPHGPCFPVWNAMRALGMRRVFPGVFCGPRVRRSHIPRNGNVGNSRMNFSRGGEKHVLGCARRRRRVADTPECAVANSGARRRATRGGLGGLARHMLDWWKRWAEPLRRSVLRDRSHDWIPTPISNLISTWAARPDTVRGIFRRRSGSCGRGLRRSRLRIPRRCRRRTSA
jgi:hypothetical protein